MLLWKQVAFSVREGPGDTSPPSQRKEEGKPAYMHLSAPQWFIFYFIKPICWLKVSVLSLAELDSGRSDGSNDAEGAS